MSSDNTDPGNERIDGVCKKAKETCQGQEDISLLGQKVGNLTDNGARNGAKECSV